MLLMLDAMVRQVPSKLPCLHFISSFYPSLQAFKNFRWLQIVSTSSCRSRYVPPPIFDVSIWSMKVWSTHFLKRKGDYNCSSWQLIVDSHTPALPWVKFSQFLVELRKYKYFVALDGLTPFRWGRRHQNFELLPFYTYIKHKKWTSSDPRMKELGLELSGVWFNLIIASSRCYHSLFPRWNDG